MKVLSIAGFSHTGKTTVAIHLMKELCQRGMRVSSIKDIHCPDFAMETVGSNTYKHWEAHHDTVLARGTHETYQIWHTPLSLAAMLAQLHADFVVVEGMKQEPLPKIICAETTKQLDELIDDCTFAISGLLSNSDIKNYRGIPVYHPVNDLAALTDLVLRKVFPVLPLADPACCTACGQSCLEMVGAILRGEANRSDCVVDSPERVQLIINGKELTLVPFVQRLLADMNQAVIANLNGYEDGEIVLHFRTKP